MPSQLPASFSRWRQHSLSLEGLGSSATFWAIIVPVVTRPILHAWRPETIAASGWSLRELYRTLETPGANRLRDARASLAPAVCAAYGTKENEDPFACLLHLNLELGEAEAKGEKITPPGLPA